jgi:hypothetical protein
MKTQIVKSIAAIVVSMVVIGCSQDEVNDRGSRINAPAAAASESETTFELSSNRNQLRTAMLNSNAQAMLSGLQRNVFSRVKSGTQPKLNLNLDSEVMKQFNKISRANVSLSSRSAGLSLAKASSQTLTAEAFCATYFDPSTNPQYSVCVTNFKSYFPNGIFIGTVDSDLPAISTAVFPLVLPGYGSGICVYARISVLAVGIACGNATGGVWAGCDVWYGCGSGSL